MKYWIEVYFENGKTLRKDSDYLNEIYAVFCRYNNGRGKPRVQMIKSTGGVLVNKVSDVCM